MADFNVDLAGATFLNVVATAIVANNGGAHARVGLKITLIETKSLLMDVEWYQWTPLVREGGPGVVRDIASISRANHTPEMPNHPSRERYAGRGAIATIAPNGATTVSVSARIAGPTDTESLAFWRKHSGATFKLVAEVIELTDSLDKIRTVGIREWPNLLKTTFTGVADLSLGRTEALAGVS